jgi:hypothetical protein
VDVVHETYVAETPSPQALFDLFADQWVSILPGFSGGSVPLFQDDRVTWALERAGGVSGKRVLELGPLEGGHTFMLHRAGAASIASIEANTLCYLKCLVVQQLFDLDSVRFELGNFIPWLADNQERFDYIHAAGVLYHIVDPVKVLEDICRATDSLYIWTHYADLEAMPESDPRYTSGVIGVEDDQYRGETYRKFRRRYLGDVEKDPKFCGGVHKNPAWIEKRTIVRVLESNGMQVEIGHDQPDHPGGPSASFFARRVG